MASSPRLARILQLQRISNASRKFATATPILPPASPNTPTVLKSLPEHNPLLPLLLSHDIPLRVAQACADRFDTYANQLRSETETKLAQYLAYRCKNPPARVYSFYLKSYSQALRDWAQSILNAALKSLKRNSAEIQNWDTTYPAPLWLPSPLDPGSAFARKDTQAFSPLSSIPAPAHAFPATYPPPLRPTSSLFPVEWPRTPAVASNSPSTSALNLDLFCIQFAKSLVIDDSPARPSRPRASIFSLPNISRSGSDISSSRMRRLKARMLDQPPRQPINQTINSPQKVAKLRQLSVLPSFPQTTPKIRTARRKASAPATMSPLENIIGSPNPPDSLLNIPQMPSNTPPPSLTSNLDTVPHPRPTTPHLTSCRPSLLGIGSSSHDSSWWSSGPITPPSFSSEVFWEPIIASPAPAPPEPFPKSTISVFTQFQLQWGCSPYISMESPFDVTGPQFDYSLAF